MSHDATQPSDALEPSPEKQGHPPGSRLTPIEQITIAHLSRQGLSIRDIAEAVGRSKNAIHANLKASRQLLEGFAHEFALDWKDASSKAATRGDHRPAMDALERLRVVEPLPKPEPAPQAPAFQINVGIGLPGVPVQHLPTMEHSVPRGTLPDIQVESAKDLKL